MKKYVLIAVIGCLIISCKLQPDSGRNYDTYNENKIYKLQLNPTAGSTYHYDITNESGIELEVDGKEVDNLNRATIGVNYQIAKDSVGDLVLNVRYDKIHIYTKNGNTETDADAANAYISSDPVERLLGLLINAKITATIDSKGEIKSMSGYKELGEKVMAGLSTGDAQSATMVKSQWEKMIGDGIIKKNMDQFFKIFPDSAIHLGDTWKMNSRQEGEINMNVKSTFTLKAINDDIAIIQSEGIMTSDQSSTIAMGYNNVVADLKGKQKGEFEVERKTGMLINCRIKADVEGTLQVMGREVPVEINSLVKIEGKKK